MGNKQNPSSVTEGKTKKRINIGGSLTRRIALISCVFLVLPLLFYSIFIYEKIYNDQLENVYSSIEHLESEQLHILTEWAEYEMKVLHLVYDLIFDLIQETQNTKKSVTYDQLKKLLENFADREDVDSIVYIGLNHCSPDLCHVSSSEVVTVNEILNNISLQQVNDENNVQQIRFLPGFGNALIFARAFPADKDPYDPLNAVIVSVVSLDRILKKLSIIRTQYKEKLSLLNENGQVLASTDPNYENRVIGFTPDASIKLKESDYSRSAIAFNVNNKLRFGSLMEYKPAGLKLLLDVPEGAVLHDWYEYLEKLVFMLGTILIFGGTAAALVSYRIAKPLRNLIQVMGSVGKGDLDKRYEKDKMGFEINQVGQEFNTMVDFLIENIKHAEEEKLQRELYHRELAIGQKAQQSLLPVTIPHIDDYDIHAGFIAAKEVGGDFYDLYLNDRGELLVAIADTSGKGIQACIFSLLARSMLRSFFDAGYPLKEIIERTNKLFMKDTGYTGMFVTAWIGIINLDTKQMHYCSCGHLPALLIDREKNIKHLNTKGVALGVAEFTPEIQEIILNKRDSLLVYTDGIVEAHSTTNELFGQGRLESLIKQENWMNAKGLVTKIQSEIRDFAQAKSQHDDLTLAAIRVLK